MTDPANPAAASGDGRAGHGLTGLADTGAFLSRLVRLDPAAVVRLRSAGSGRTELWSRLPWSVLVQRTVDGAGPGDATVSAAALLAEVTAVRSALPPRQDGAWRWPLPAGAPRVVETVAVDDVRRVAAAAAGTLRTAAVHGVGGRAVGQRALRDALLDHVAIVVTAEGPPAERVEVPQRLVQAVIQMGFLGTASAQPLTGSASFGVRVRRVGHWVALDAPFGVGWIQRVNALTFVSMMNHTKV
ncbi:hypothetical protein ACN27F_26665 [Solwaraspora sp. WMMB335]|uniref:hypothetical protein n=1 Tax=Solwaraspora sp. WMMB335 TaxID=3404118 RepID=UPI003B954DF4